MLICLISILVQVNLALLGRPVDDHDHQMSHIFLGLIRRKQYSKFLLSIYRWKKVNYQNENYGNRSVQREIIDQTSQSSSTFFDCPFPSNLVF